MNSNNNYGRNNNELYHHHHHHHSAADDETTSLLVASSSATTNNNNRNNNNGNRNRNNPIRETTTTRIVTYNYGTATPDDNVDGAADEEDQQQQQIQDEDEEISFSSSSSSATFDDEESNNNPTISNSTGPSETGGGGGGGNNGNTNNNEDGLSSTTTADGNEGNGESGEEETTTTTTQRDGTIGTLTRRLRCLFSTITWPIVPLGTIVALALLWVLYAASSSDLKKSCSHPLHWYALASLILVAYIPHHAQVRSHLFHYSRERDGPIRPARVRMYDQFFHTICLLYVYTGVTLIQTCREDMITTTTHNITTGSEYYDQQQQQQQELNLSLGGNEGGDTETNPMNTCEATCPNLYQALSVYVATLEMFTFALILPLLFLPCIYLWFLRRATAEAEAFAQLQDRLQEEESLLANGGGVTANEILDSLENVKLVSRRIPPLSSLSSPHNDAEGSHNGTAAADYYDGEGGGNNNGERRQIWLLPTEANDASIGMNSNVKECCICMSDFTIQDETDLEDGLGDTTTTTTPENPAAAAAADNATAAISSTRNTSSSAEEQEHHNDGGADVGPTYKGIVRTRCGHIFHKECLSGWVGGRWQLNSSGGGNNNNDDESDNRRRRARQTQCPLCREDLRPSPPPAVSSSSPP